ncbi:MAG: zinc-dependent peptidase [Nannocystaceae bacterium]
MLLSLVRRLRRRALLRHPFPEAWRAIMDRNVPMIRRLPPEDRRELEGLIQIFLAEKSFEGCGGQTVDDAVRVTIAAQACLLLLHRDTDVYPRLDVILVYPSSVRSRETRREGLVVQERESVRLGESWSRGAVILAWDAVLAGAREVADGHNVTLHELAHQLDGEDGAMDGEPPLRGRSSHASWARVLGAEYQELLHRLQRGHRSDIDPYAATSPPEFFAVITEMFFERPRALQRRHPALYRELAGFYRQDPASWPEARP